MMALTIIIYIIIMLVAAAVVIFVSVRAYNRRLDKIASGEVRNTHSSIPEPSTTVGVVYKIVLLILVVMTLLALSTAKGMIFSMQNNVDDLQSKLNQLSLDIDDLKQQLEDNERIVSLYEWDIQDPDYIARTVKVFFSVTLKEYSEDTSVALNLGGQTIELAPTLNPGEYGGQFIADFFEKDSNPLICIREGAKTYVEKCDFDDKIFWQFLPMPKLECNYSFGVKFGKTSYDGEYTIVPEHLEDIESVTVTYLTNGTELKAFDATRQTLEHEEISLEKGMDLDKDLCLRIEIVTKTGFKVVEQTTLFSEATSDYEDTDYLRIMDLNGNVVWEDN